MKLLLISILLSSLGIAQLQDPCNRLLEEAWDFQEISEIYSCSNGQQEGCYLKGTKNRRKKFYFRSLDEFGSTYEFVKIENLNKRSTDSLYATQVYTVSQKKDWRSDNKAVRKTVHLTGDTLNIDTYAIAENGKRSFKRVNSTSYQCVNSAHIFLN